MRQSLLIGTALSVFLLAGCASGPSSELEQGWKLMVAEDYPAARDHYEDLLREYPDNPYALLNLGVAYQRLENFDRARPNYEAAVVHGTRAEVTRVAEVQGIAPRTTTIAELAQQNLDSLPN